MEWYKMADAKEVYNELNQIAMGFEPYHLFNEATYGDAVRQYEFDEDTFYKAEALWAEKEGLI